MFINDDLRDPKADNGKQAFEVEHNCQVKDEIFI